MPGCPHPSGVTLSCPVGPAGTTHPTHPRAAEGKCHWLPVIWGWVVRGLEDLPPGQVLPKSTSCGSVPATEQLNPGLSNRGNRESLGSSAPGWDSASSSCSPEPGQGSVPSRGMAQSATGRVKPRMELIFSLRNHSSCPRLLWKALTLGKKGTSKGSAVFHQELQASGLVWLPPAQCECFEGHKCTFPLNTGLMGH